MSNDQEDWEVGYDAEGLRELLGDDEPCFVRAVAENRSTPCELQLAILSLVGSAYGIAEAVGYGEDTDLTVLHVLSDHDDPCVRQHVARNENTEPETLDLMVADPAPLVRYALTQNPRLTKAAMNFLAEDPNVMVRAEARSHQRAEEAYQEQHGELSELEEYATFMECRLGDSNPHFVLAVALDPDTEFEEVLDILEVSDLVSMTRDIASLTTDERVLSQLAEHPSDEVRQTVAGNQHTPTDVLHSLVSDDNVMTRWALANNRQSGKGTLQTLEGDPNDFVSNSAKRALKMQDTENK